MGYLMLGDKIVSPQIVKEVEIPLKKYGVDISSVLGDTDGNGVLQEPISVSGDLIFTGVEDIGTKVLMNKFVGSTVENVEFPDLTKLSNESACETSFKDSKVKVLSLPKLSQITGKRALYQAFYGTDVEDVEFPELTTIQGGSSQYPFYDTFYNCKKLKSISFPKMKNIPYDGMDFMCIGCSALTTINFPELETVAQRGLISSFSDCTGLTSVEFPKLKRLTGQAACANLLKGAINLTSVSFPELETIVDYALHNAFEHCERIKNITFPKLKSIGTMSFQSAFSYCYLLEEVHFPALDIIESESDSFGPFYTTFYSKAYATGHIEIYFDSLKTTSFVTTGKGAFRSMFSSNGGDKRTFVVHFPSNTEETIAALPGYPAFGGSSSRVTLSFDLPATE